MGQFDAVMATHEAVVTEVKKCLQESAQAEGGPAVDLKISHPKMENMVEWVRSLSGLILIHSSQAQYEYETGDHTQMQVYERTLESPYTFSLPAKVSPAGFVFSAQSPSPFMAAAETAGI